MDGTLKAMVNWSSIDPIEEARARVRLKYSRAKPAHPGAATIGKTAARVARKALPDKGPAIAKLKSRWSEIVGEQIAKLTRPERISASKDGRVLTLRVIPAAATLVQHQSETIRQRVSVAAGGDVRAIKLVQGPLGSGAQAARRVKPAKPLTPEEAAALDASTSGIEDARLRAAIVALGKAVLAREDTVSGT